MMVFLYGGNLIYPTGEECSYDFIHKRQSWNTISFGGIRARNFAANSKKRYHKSFACVYPYWKDMGYNMSIEIRSNQTDMTAKVAVDVFTTKTYVNVAVGDIDTIAMTGSIEKTVIQGEA
jgi:hypothetical protein